MLRGQDDHDLAQLSAYGFVHLASAEAGSTAGPGRPGTGDLAGLPGGQAESDKAIPDGGRSPGR
jgi:hypothetical protein